MRDVQALGRQGLGVLAGRIGAVVAQYLLFIVLARLYGAQGVGLFALTLSVWMLAGLIARFGLDVGAVQAIAAERAAAGIRPEGALPGAPAAPPTRTAASVLVVGFLLSVAVGALLFVGTPVLTRLFGKPELRPELAVASFGIPFLALAWLGAGLLQGARRVSTAIWLRDVAHPVLMTLGVAALAWLPRAAHLPFAAVMSASAAVVGVWVLVLCVREFGLSAEVLFAPDTESIRAVVLYSLPFSLATLGNAGTQWVDRLLVGSFLPIQELGLYDAAARLVKVVAVSYVAASVVFAPIAGGLWSRRERQSLESIYQTAARWALLLSVPGAVLLLLRPVPFLELFGGDFTAAVDVLRILVAGQLVNVVTGPAGHLLLATGHQRREAAYMLVNVGLVLVLGVWLIPRRGIVGAAIAVAASMAVTNIIRAVQGWRLVRAQPLSLGMWRAAAAGGIAALGLAVIPVPAGLSLVFLVLEQIALASLLYAGALLAFGLGDEDREFLAALLPGRPRGAAGRGPAPPGGG